MRRRGCEQRHHKAVTGCSSRSITRLWAVPSAERAIDDPVITHGDNARQSTHRERAGMTGTALGAPRTDRALPRGRHARVEHRPRPAKVVVVGQGRAGVQVALRAVRAGYLVIGLDRDVRRISRLAHGRSGVDAATDTALVAALRGGDYVPTGDRRLAEGFDTAVIAATDEPAAAPQMVAAVAAYARPGATVIVETLPGATRGPPGAGDRAADRAEPVGRPRRRTGHRLGTRAPARLRRRGSLRPRPRPAVHRGDDGVLPPAGRAPPACRRSARHGPGDGGPPDPGTLDAAPPPGRPGARTGRARAAGAP